MPRYAVWAGLGVLLGLAFVVAFTLTRPYTFRGSEINPPIPATDFTLTDADGNDFRLSDQQGNLLMLFFGYTTCPDICPATLGEMKQIRSRLLADSRYAREVDNLKFVFITVDPGRDTAEKLGKYVASFDPTFVGLTGSEADLEPVWNSYGVYRAISETDSSVGYLVDHTTRVYLVDRSGNLRLTYSFGTPVDDILQDMRHLLREKDS